MIFQPRTEVIRWDDFFNPVENTLTIREKRNTTILLATSIFTYLGSTTIASASITDHVISACYPIIDLLQGVSYPVSFIMVSGGFLLIMIGQKSKGLRMIKWAAIGYIGLQFAPAIMQILVEVGKAMKP